MDVKTTFLIIDLKEEVYMKQPKGFEEYGDKHLECKRSKTLYMFHKAL